MNFYPPELVTPPLSLIALLGCPQLHGEVSEYLRWQKPPINAKLNANPWAAAEVFGERKNTLTAPSSQTGILKAGWFAKHRQERPAVAVLFLEREAVVGDPKGWQTSCSALEAVRSGTRSRGARTVVVVVGSTLELPEERAGAISRIAAIDKRWLVTYSPDEEGEAGLRKLCSLFFQAASQFYLDTARRLLALHAERRSNSPELNARVAFKAAALAEFRADWATAVKTYQNAYSEVARVGLAGPSPLQRAHEVAAVAEQVHVKVVTLLLHQRRIAEALAQFGTHMRLFRRPPFTPPPAFAAAHWGWVSRQYSVMGELLGTRMDPSLLPAQRDAQPAYFLLCSAQAAIERRRAAQRAKDLRAGKPPGPLPDKPAPGQYVGQVVVLEPPRRLTDEEFVHFLEAGCSVPVFWNAAVHVKATLKSRKSMLHHLGPLLLVTAAGVINPRLVLEASVNHSSLSLERLSVAQELCARAAGSRGTRQAYYIGRLMAREHLVAGDPTTARRLLLSVAGIYRRERWEGPLAAALVELRECAQRLSLSQEHILHSLEVACLQSSLSEQKRKDIAAGALTALLSWPQAGSPTSPSKAPQPQAHVLQVKPVNHPLLTCFALSAGFAPLPESPCGSNTAGRLAEVTFGVALRSEIPANLPVAKLEVVFEDAQGSRPVAATPEEGTSEGSAASTSGRSLSKHTTLTWEVRLQARCGGSLIAKDIVLHIGDHTRIIWPLATFPAGLGMIGGAMARQQEPLLRQPTSLVTGLYSLQIPSAHSPPTFEAHGDTFAMVGEQILVSFQITAADALIGASLRVQANYLEGGNLPRLTFAHSAPEATQSVQSTGSGGVEPSPSTATVNLGPLAIGDLPAGQSHAVEVMVALERSGQLKLTATLSCTPDTGADAEAISVDATLEIAVESPFELTTHLTAPPRTSALILTPNEASTSPAKEGAEEAPLEVLPTSEACLLTAHVRVTAPCEVELLQTDIATTSGVETLDTADPNSTAALLRKGDIFTSVFRLQASTALPAASLGNLNVTWKRRRKPGEKGSDAAVQTRLPLPRVVFADAVLRVSAECPQHAVAGEAFPLLLRMRNPTPLLQQLTLAVGDASGFVIAGSRHVSVSVLPRQESEVLLSLVAYSPGNPQLPHMRVTSLRYNAIADPLAGRRIFVAPARIPERPAAIASSERKATVTI